MKIINCKDIKNKKIPIVKDMVGKLGYTPRLAIIQVGKDVASSTYVTNKLNLAKELGIDATHIHMHETSPLNEVKKTINHTIHNVDGCILQLPLPQHLKQYEQELLDIIPSEIDVDCLSTTSIGLLHSGRAKFYPCTAQACIDILDEYEYDLDGMNVLIIGRQQLLGYPLFRMMTDRNATVTLAHSHTQDLDSMLESGEYDIVVSAIGIPHHLKNINTDFILDVGINRDEEGKLCGDIDLSTCNFNYATTVGGGIGGLGQLTVLNLMNNTTKGEIK